MTLNPTQEQSDAIEKFQTGQNLKINAFAGTGKTSTLTLLGKSSQQRGLYLAFNKSIATDAQNKFPNTVTCKTTHSLAYGATPRAYKVIQGKMSDKLYGRQISQLLNLSPISMPEASFLLKPESHGYLIAETIKHYCQGSDVEICSKHVPRYGRIQGLSEKQVDEVACQIAFHAGVLWRKMIDPSDRVPLGHDGYLKLWALSSPRIAADFLLLDEAQDTNQVVLGVLALQRCQVVYVGDKHQQIYEWRGAVNAMERVETPLNTHLTQSFRFGPEIADAASRILSTLGENLLLTGNQDKQSYVGCANARALLSRTNAQVMSNIITRQTEGDSVHIVGGTGDLNRLLDGVSKLKSGQPSDMPEFFGFKNWQEVVEFSKEDEGAHLKTFVRLVTSHGDQQLKRALLNCVQSEDEADVIVSTAHKSKGREWDTVSLSGDFLNSVVDKDGNPKPPEDSEVRLFYVAVTRGKIAVDIDSALASQFQITMKPMPCEPRKKKNFGVPDSSISAPNNQSAKIQTLPTPTPLQQTQRASSGHSRPLQQPQKKGIVGKIIHWLFG